MVFTLVLVLLLLLALAGALHRLGRGEAIAGPLERPHPLDSAASAAIYRPLGRLFSTEDRAFLGCFGDRGRNLAGNLGAARGRVLRLYLGQIRTDFGDVWRLARQMAPHSPDPDFASQIAKQWMIFHGVLGLVYVWSWFGWRLPLPMHLERLVTSLEALRNGVRTVVQQVESAMLPPVVSRG